jgi:hypothetical protein
MNAEPTRCRTTMADNAPFHVQLDDHLRRRYWTPCDLLAAMHAMNGRCAWVFVSSKASNQAADLEAILNGTLAPTEPLGELIADLVIGAPPGLDVEQQRAREALVGAAYVAECHGRRQQPPYTHGVFGDSRRSNSAGTVDQTDARQEKVREQRRQRTLARLIELEERQSRQRTRRLPASPQSPMDPYAHWRANSRRLARHASQWNERLAKATQVWTEAATEALAYLPSSARRKDPHSEHSFIHVLAGSFNSGKRLHEFLERLLIAWRSEGQSRRGRQQARMSPEQLGAWIGKLNRKRSAGDPARQSWFRQHKGPAVTGSSLRNYLAGTSERPQSECIQKMLWALVPDGEIQIAAELRLWRMSRTSYPIEPRQLETLLKVLESDWTLPTVRRQIGADFPLAQRWITEARMVKVQLGDETTPFQALTDCGGVLLTPLVHPLTRCLAADVAAIDPESGTLLTPIDLALATEDRGALMRALLDFSGMPITRVAKLTEVHETLFQQWMREGRNRRIEDRTRAERIVHLLNPPELARWPIEAEQVRRQNEQAVRLLTTNVCSLAQALRNTKECTIPEEYQLDAEKEKTYRAAFLLRQTFGKDSLSNLTGAEVGRLLTAQQLGDAQSFKHLREGVRARGKKAARRATLEQAYFLATLLEQTVGPFDEMARKQFLEGVACVGLSGRGQLASPSDLLRRVVDSATSYTIRDMTRELMRRSGGLVKFSRKIGVSQQTLRAFVSQSSHYLHHPVARRLAERGMGFLPGSEEYRRFVVLSTAAWRKGNPRDHVRLSSIFHDYSERRPTASTPRKIRALRAQLMGQLLAQGALAPRELAAALKVTPAVLAGWTTTRSGRFTSQEALDRFVRLMRYEEEQVDFIQEVFGPSSVLLIS